MPSISLEDYGIYLNTESNLDSIARCPQELKELFTLILSVQSLEWNLFGGTALESNGSVQATPVMQYESELKVEAEHLAVACCDPKRGDDVEDQWVIVLQPIVFYRFNREAEEVYKRRRHHHCFICGKHFPLRSRPLLGALMEESFNKNIRSIHDDEVASQDANVCEIHVNMSNFDTDKVTYLGFEKEKRKTPDLTVGLLIWSRNLCRTPPGMSDKKLKETLQHDLVRPFRNDRLDGLEKEKHVEPLIAFPKPKKGTHVSRASRPSINFPFILWEAKRAGEGDPVAQNALKVKMILQWQQDLASRAGVSWDPLVFHFVNVGAEWKIYVCHIHTPTGKGKSTCLFRLLWDGNCANRTKALQLLYLVDIIALWGQFQYKPFAGACIRILGRKKMGRRSSGKILDVNFLEHQRAINTRNFRSIQHLGKAAIPPVELLSKLQRAGTSTPEDDVETQLAQRMRVLKVENYFIPEKDGFIWLLHRELHDVDLLVIRVTSGGSKLAPLIIFNDANWSSQGFRDIIVEEKVRMPQNVEIDFRYDENDMSVLEKCFNATNGSCTMSEVQFCAILPLNRREVARGDMQTQSDLQPLEQILGLSKLIKAAECANERWCSCQQPGTGAMIQCPSTRCKIGWYHHACVGLPSDYENQDWICDACKKSGTITFASYDDHNHKFRQDIIDASDARIQRVKSLSRVWNNHEWPKARAVRDLMYHKICCGIEMRTNAKKFRNTVETLESKRCDANVQQCEPKTRCWAVLRHDPRQLTRIRQRFRDSREL